ncbi:MAG TPA: NAD(P)H-dependent oxidoreductase [Solirubrobacteraceae bacterium]|nr:NAD(P)H-dependent oxidoreductase [Solirubrobacteraceae bacterium]
MRILGISGSLRRDSHNTKLLRAAARLLPPGAELELFDGLKAVAPFDADDDRGAIPPRGVSELRSAIRGADALLIAAPEYNHSIPGVLKNAIDWASRPLETAALLNKPVAVIGASTGMFGAVWSQAETRKALAGAGARVLDRELAVGSADEQFHPLDGHLLDPDLEAALGGILLELASEVQPALVGQLGLDQPSSAVSSSSRLPHGSLLQTR